MKLSLTVLVLAMLAEHDNAARLLPLTKRGKRTKTQEALLEAQKAQLGAQQAQHQALEVEQAQDPRHQTQETLLEVQEPEVPQSLMALAALPQQLYNHISSGLTYHNIGEEILTFPGRRPRLFNVLLATCKTWTADAVVQYVESRRSASWRFDMRRSAAFGVFGFLYIGLTQWVFYVTLLTWLFPDAMVFANSPLSVKLQDRTGQIQLAGQVFADCIFGAFVYFPVFYIIKELMQKSGSVSSQLRSGLDKYRENILSDNLASCALWIPANTLIFAVPMYLRMPLEHCVSFSWTMFMSARRGATQQAFNADMKDDALKSEAQ